MQKLKEAIEIIRADPENGSFKGNIKESTISTAESLLGLAMPPSYKHFLSEFGAGNYKYKEFYGITREVDLDKGSVPNAIWYTLDQRTTDELPPGLIVVGASDFNELFVIDTRTVDADKESPVAIWIPGLSKKNDKLQVVAKSFGEYLLNEISGI